MRNRNLAILAVFQILVMMPLIAHASTLSRGAVTFTGQEIRDDKQTGLIVSPSIGMPFVTVGSLYHDFTLHLPYSESWKLESGTDVALFAQDKYYIASVNIGILPDSDCTQREYYERFLENMKGSGEFEMRGIEIIKIPKTEKLILRYQSKKTRLPAKYRRMNKWRWNYWAAVPYESKWYALHLSARGEDEEWLRREEPKIMFTLDSLSPGAFKRKMADKPSTSIHKENRFRYENPLYGELHFTVPESWKSSHEKSFERQTETIIFTPKSGNSFQLMIDPLAGRKIPPQDQVTIEEQVERSGKRLLSNAKEKQLKILELKGNYSSGYYYTLTDRAPKPGEWEYITKGRIGAGAYLLNFTIFTHSLDVKEINEALGMLGSVRFENSGTPLK